MGHMEFILMAAAWWLVGFSMFIHVCWLITPVIKVKDVAVGLAGGFFGPIGILFYCWAPERPTGGFFNRILFQKRID